MFRTTFEYRRNKYLSLHTSYTWSKAIDDGSIVTTQGGDNDLPQDPDSRQAERGLSNYDLRHYFVSYVTTELPRFGGPEWLTAGWQFNAISTLASGNPFSVVVGGRIRDFRVIDPDGNKLDFCTRLTS